MSYSLLFSDDDAKDQENFLCYLRGYAGKLGVTSLEVDEDALKKCLGGMKSMPWPLGVSKASVFKKVASFTTNFVYYAPILTEFPEPKFGRLSKHQNAIAALDYSAASLLGATINCPHRGPQKLSKPILMSKHYWQEFVSTISNTNPQDHLQCVALIYEALAYRANVDACYSKLYGSAFPELVVTAAGGSA